MCEYYTTITNTIEEGSIDGGKEKAQDKDVNKQMIKGQYI